MIVLDDSSKCSGCLACGTICPKRCITFVTDFEGFLYPQVNDDDCIGCNRCETVCPVLNAAGKAPVLESYAARSHEEELMRNSSSGGIFSELCKPIINNGGVVYGVVMDDDCRGCSFIRADDYESIAKMRGSKYIQAYSGDVYKRVESDLKDGRKVLFTGTPCQVNALSLYLGDKRKNLLLVDFICHGVPSPLLWSKSIDALEKQVDSNVVSVNFRYKEANLNDSRLSSIYGETVIYKSLEESPYLQMFLRNTCLRESCYTCSAKNTRLSDLTIADFWGIEKVLPEMSDKLGCSLVIVRTTSGHDILNEISHSIEQKPVAYDVAVSANPAVSKSVERPKGRDSLFQDLETLGYARVASKYGALSKRSRIKKLIRSVLDRTFIHGIRKRFRGASRQTLRYGIVYYLTRPRKHHEDAH